MKTRRQVGYPMSGQRGFVHAQVGWLAMSVAVFGGSDLREASLLAQEAARGERGMVATVHPLATQAGRKALAQGGNAIDAAVAAALTLGVVDGHNSGIGGGCFLLIRRADGELLAIDGREMAPAAAHRDMFLRAGVAQPQLSQQGPLASGVPGALAAYQMALQSGGNLSLAQLLEPAAQIAETGFAIDRNYAARLASTASNLQQDPACRAILLKPDGQPWQEGETLRQPDLAETYRAIAKQGPDWFYRGPFAERLDAWMAANGGIMTRADLAQYRAKRREPLQIRYRGLTVVGFPPPSSGGIHVAQILQILQRFDLAAIERDDPAQFVHLVAEAMKLAFADRAYWLGDADFAAVPRGLIDPDYCQRLSQRIELERTVSVPSAGQPPAADTLRFEPDLGRHTTHIATADSQGNWVALTATVNTTFGAKVIIPGTGVIMNNEMDDFSIQPGVPNAFGLVGAEANAIAPGKRPLSSMSPTIVLKDGQPIFTVGAAGGPTIISQVVLAILHRIDLQRDLPACLAIRRFHHQWAPDLLRMEPGYEPELVDQLQRRGHRIQASSRLGVTQAIALDADGKTLLGIFDPRVPGAAAGY